MVGTAGDRGSPGASWNGIGVRFLGSGASKA